MEEPQYECLAIGSLHPNDPDRFCTASLSYGDNACVYKLIAYRGANRCAKCAFAYDQKNCEKHDCEFPSGTPGYWRYFRTAGQSMKDLQY